MVQYPKLKKYMRETGDYCSFCANLQMCLDTGYPTDKRCALFRFDPDGGANK